MLSGHPDGATGAAPDADAEPAEEPDALGAIDALGTGDALDVAGAAEAPLGLSPAVDATLFTAEPDAPPFGVESQPEANTRLAPKQARKPRRHGQIFIGGELSACCGARNRWGGAPDSA